jgi:class 3 adenylate cyclase
MHVLHDVCRQQYDAEGRPIWRGLRVRIGMSYGFVNNKKPLNTGRADYFGVLPNGAARVSALAAPGQVCALNALGLDGGVQAIYAGALQLRVLFGVRLPVLKAAL